MVASTLAPIQPVPRARRAIVPQMADPEIGLPQGDGLQSSLEATAALSEARKLA